MEDDKIEETKVETLDGDKDKAENLDEDENVTAEVFEQSNNLVEESREVEF